MQISLSVFMFFLTVELSEVQLKNRNTSHSHNQHLITSFNQNWRLHTSWRHDLLFDSVLCAAVLVLAGFDQWTGDWLLYNTNYLPNT